MQLEKISIVRTYPSGRPVVLDILRDPVCEDMVEIKDGYCCQAFCFGTREGFLCPYSEKLAYSCPFNPYRKKFEALA